jgi:RNA-binding protein
MTALTGKQRRSLRALGHALSPVVQVGKEGLTDALCQALDQALLTHELVKVRIGQNATEDRHELAAKLSEQTGAQVAQILGNTVLLYRPHPDEPKLKLP